MEINSKEYWDYRFENNWEYHGGKEQTAGFMDILIANLPQEILLYFNQSVSILDWGCAEGQGVDLLSKTFTASNVTGLDVSEIAIQKSKLNYPDYDFIQGYLNPDIHKFDAIITSNCLEHFDEPFEWVYKILECTNKYFIVLVPFEENIPKEDLSHEHKYSFSEDSFPNTIKGFNKAYCKIIDNCGQVYPLSEILVVYRKA